MLKRIYQLLDDGNAPGRLMILRGVQRYGQIFMKRSDISVRDEQVRQFNMWPAGRRAKQSMRNNFGAKVKCFSSLRGCEYRMLVLERIKTGNRQFVNEQ